MALKVSAEKLFLHRSAPPHCPGSELLSALCNKPNPGPLSATGASPSLLLPYKDTPSPLLFVHFKKSRRGAGLLGGHSASGKEQIKLRPTED